MGTDTYRKRVEEIFVAAIEHDTDTRGAFITSACGGDESLRADIQSLLDADADAREFLNHPPLDFSADDAPADLLGRTIGGCRINRVIARGGMGTVYEAQQTHPNRKVAIKILKRRFASPSSLRRFEHEADLLGALQHPGIAQVYDAGSYDDGSGGVLYFVMEYVPGAKSLTSYAEAHHLGIHERLRLFADVCDAVNEAHQKGIIHRDLKPGNVLVDEDGRVKIIDFGVARATNADISATTMHTEIGQLIGTIHYMSPEQCEGDVRRLDNRSDVYSLGVLLYELLCAQLPYDMSDTTYLNAALIIREVEPLRPSTITRALRGDVELIMLKALAKDRQQRYQTAGDLGRDILRSFNHEPIEARPPTTWTRVLRWIGRHPIAATTSASLIVALLTLALTALTVWTLTMRPVETDIDREGRNAYLFSRMGNIIQTWSSEQENGVTVAEFVTSSELNGGRPVVVIGYGHGAAPEDARCLTWYSAVGGDRDKAIHRVQITDADLPAALIREGVSGEKFAPAGGIQFDVFPEHDGEELIVTFNHSPRSICLIRIYDRNGELLYQAWHDGHVQDLLWRKEWELLLVTAVNSEAFWYERGFEGGGNAHPRVIFALKPKRFEFDVNATRARSTDDRENCAVWYKCLMPPEASSLLAVPWFRPMRQIDQPEKYQWIEFTLAEDVTHPAAINWLIDEHGGMVPGTRSITDNYRLKLSGVLDPDTVHLENLPPIVAPLELKPPQPQPEKEQAVSD